MLPRQRAPAIKKKYFKQAPFRRDLRCRAKSESQPAANSLGRFTNEAGAQGKASLIDAYLDWLKGLQLETIEGPALAFQETCLEYVDLENEFVVLVVLLSDTGRRKLPEAADGDKRAAKPEEPAKTINRINEIGERMRELEPIIVAQRRRLEEMTAGRLSERDKAASNSGA